MKNIYIIFSILFALAYACKEDNESNEEATGNGALTIKLARTSITDTVPAYYRGVVTILNEQGEAVLDNKIVLFNKTKTYYQTDSMLLSSGTYTITRLTLYDSTWNCVYVSPIKDSKVGKANKGVYLPYDAVISSDFSIKAFPGMVKASEYLPSELGYVSLYYSKAESISFKLATWEGLVDNVYFYTAPKLTITTDSFKYVKTLNDSINTIEVPNLSKDLQFEFSNSGYETVTTVIPRDTLLKYSNNPLLIYTRKL
jgi:hypothetical protein